MRMAHKWVERWQRPSKKLDQGPTSFARACETHPEHGELQSMEQLANWVRFADTKATILFAGLGVALTLSLSSVSTTAHAVQRGGSSGAIVGITGALTAIAFLWTLSWLLCAINPSRTSGSTTPNRFAWPTLTALDLDEFEGHLDQVDMAADARRQCLDLARLARRKYLACTLAVWGYGVFLLLAVSTMLATVIATP